MHRVLVAGATGYLGRFVAQEFKQQGWWVRALARNPDKLRSRGPFLEPAIDGLVDDVFVGQATVPGTLHGVCDGIDVVFSSIGLTRQHDKLSYMQVDYQANRNLLDAALAAGSVRKFIFVHSFGAQRLPFLPAFQAKQKFVDELQASRLDRAIVCPNGFFNDMTAFLRMAQRGTVWLIGDGQAHLNPIHGADLARACVDAAGPSLEEIPIGGPLLYSYEEIAELAFAVLHKPSRIRYFPAWLAKSMLPLVGMFSARYYTLAAGITALTQQDMLAPPCGTHTLREYYEQLSSRP